MYLLQTLKHPAQWGKNNSVARQGCPELLLLLALFWRSKTLHLARERNNRYLKTGEEVVKLL